jgi:hypothetical protein
LITLITFWLYVTLRLEKDGTTDKGKLAVMLGRKATEPSQSAGCVAKEVRKGNK